MSTRAAGKAFTGTGQAVPASGPSVAVAGLAVIDTSGSTNVVSVYDGTSTSGTLIGTVSVAANGSADLSFAYARACTTGVYINCTGAVKGTVWLA